MSVTVPVLKVEVVGRGLPHVHVLHAHDDVASVVLECAVEVDNVGRIALVHDAQLAHDALAHLVLGFDVYDLQLSVPVMRVVCPT